MRSSIKIYLQVIAFGFLVLFPFARASAEKSAQAVGQQCAQVANPPADQCTRCCQQAFPYSPLSSVCVDACYKQVLPNNECLAAAIPNHPSEQFCSTCCAARYGTGNIFYTACQQPCLKAVLLAPACDQMRQRLEDLTNQFTNQCLEGK